MSWVTLKKNNETLKRHPLQGPITSTGAFLEPFQELFKPCQGHLKTQQPCHPQTSPGQSSIILKFEKPHVYKTTCERAHDRSTADNWCNPNKSQLQDMNHQIRQSDYECCCCPDNICPMVCMRPDRTHTLPDWASHPQTNGSRERVIPRVLEGERENKWVEEEGREGVSLGPWEPSLCQCKRAIDNFIPSPLPHLSQWGTPLPKHNADQHLTIYCCYSIPWVRRRLQSDWTVPAVCVCVHYCCAMTLSVQVHTHTYQQLLVQHDWFQRACEPPEHLPQPGGNAGLYFHFEQQEMEIYFKSQSLETWSWLQIHDEAQIFWLLHSTLTNLAVSQTMSVTEQEEVTVKGNKF